MILLRKAYRGHYIEIRPERPGAGEPPRQAQVWLDGERLDSPRPCTRSSELGALWASTRAHLDGVAEKGERHAPKASETGIA